MTDFTNRLHLAHHHKAPMAGVSTPELAAAVSNAGGLGSIAVGASTLGAGEEHDPKGEGAHGSAFQRESHSLAVPYKARRSAWIEYLTPLFAELGATPPTSSREIYASFVTDEAMFALLLEQ